MRSKAGLAPPNLTCNLVFMWVSKQSRRIDRLQVALQDVSVRLEKLDNKEAARDRHMRELETEWKSTFEKFNTLWARLQRRIPSKAPEKPAESPNTERAINTLAIDLFKSGRML